MKDTKKLDQQFSVTDVIAKSVRLSGALVEVSRHFRNDVMGTGNLCVLIKQLANACPMGAFQRVSMQELHHLAFLIVSFDYTVLMLAVTICGAGILQYCC